MITNCNTDGTGTFVIDMCAQRIKSAEFIVSSFSFSRSEANNDAAFQRPISRGLENRKCRFGRMLARSIKTGLFENVEMKMHRFKAGDVVTVFQMHPRKGLMIEGKATVLKRIADVDEQYKVRFHGRDGKPALGEEYERFVDTWGQDDPQKYVREFNAKIGHSTISPIINARTGKPVTREEVAARFQ